MLFFNIDHIERALLSQSRKASSKFFFGSACMCEVFARLENAEPTKAALPAKRAAEHFEVAANSFRALAETISIQYSWVKEAVKGVSFADAARDVRLSPDSRLVQTVTAELLRDGLDGVLRSCADEVSQFAGRLRQVSSRVLSKNVLLDFEYEQAHSLLGDWRALATRGQYVSSVCLQSARVSA